MSERIVAGRSAVAPRPAERSGAARRVNEHPVGYLGRAGLAPECEESR